MSRLAVGLIVAVSVWCSDIAPEVLQLAHIQSKAKQGLSNIPAYVCSETMLREGRANARIGFRRLDEVRLEVAEIGGKELFSKPGEKQFNDDGLKQYATRGLVATGMFYQMAQTIFGSPVARFHFAAKKRVKGRRAVQYDMVVPALFANYRLNFNYHQAQCGIKGSIWADEQSDDLIRMRIEATDIPPELLLKSAVTEIDYQRTSLDGKSYLIPASAEVATVMLDGGESRNDIRFSNCHKYGVESTITFQ